MCFSTRVFPTKLKSAVVIPILKKIRQIFAQTSGLPISIVLTFSNVHNKRKEY